MTSRTDGWDGWISMGGTGYGVTHDSSTGAFGGYAWGDVNVGWVDFSGVSTEPLSCQIGAVLRCGVGVNEDSNSLYDTSNGKLCRPCDVGTTCSNGSCTKPVTACSIEVKPMLIGASNVGATVSWNVTNVKTCSVKATNGESWPAPVVNDAAINPMPEPKSSALNSATTFTMTCTGLDNEEHSCSAKAEFAPSYQEF